MRSFVPTDIYVEKDCVKNHANQMLAVGTRALIMTGRHSAVANGSLNDVESVLNSGNIPFQVFNEVEGIYTNVESDEEIKISEELMRRYVEHRLGGSGKVAWE